MTGPHVRSESQCDVPPGLGPVVAVAAGPDHTCAVSAAGKLVCFGYNIFGRCEVPRLLTPAAQLITPPHQIPQADPSSAVLQLADHTVADMTEEDGADRGIAARHHRKVACHAVVASSCSSF